MLNDMLSSNEVIATELNSGLGGYGRLYTVLINMMYLKDVSNSATNFTSIEFLCIIIIL